MTVSEYIHKKAMIAVLTEISLLYGHELTIKEIIYKLKEETNFKNLS